MLCSVGPRADSLADHLQTLPEPPPVDKLIGLPDPIGRGAYRALIVSEAEKAGIPPALVDAVVRVESNFKLRALGGVGEIGLMQIRPETAAMLGYRGDLAGLYEPHVNVAFGVRYLAGAWRLAGGNLCRALMKYRAGHGEERMSALSVEYCRRARIHLAGIGSPLAMGALPAAGAEGAVVAASVQRLTTAGIRPPARMVEPAFERELRLARAKARAGTRTAADSARFWRAQEARIRELAGRTRQRLG
jgi:Transglycosylase SLT domain